jgi:uncharacterized protein (TIGR00369 family)
MAEKGWFLDGPSRFLGFRYEAAGRARMEVREDLLNPVGLLAGTVVFGLVDYTMGSALWAQTTENEHIATLNISLNYVATAREGAVICTANVDRRTRTNAVLRAEVVAEEGERLIATAIGAFAIFPPRGTPLPSLP